MEKGEKMDRFIMLDLGDKEDAYYFGKKFLNSRNWWKAQIRKKNAELKSITELKGITYSEVHSGNIGNPTQNTAFAEMKVEEDIQRYENYEYVLSYGLNHISDQDKDILTALQNNKWKLTSAIISELSIKYDCDPRTIYNRRRYAILNFVEAIREIINY